MFENHQKSDFEYFGRENLNICCFTRNFAFLAGRLNFFVKKSEKCQTPLHYACENGNSSIIQHIIPLNINFNPTDVNQMTPLHWACKEGKVEAVQLLFSNVSIDVNVSNNEGKTPLHLACQNGNCEIVKLLLKEEGINVDATDQNGMTAFQIASQLSHLEIVQLLLSAKE